MTVPENKVIMISGANRGIGSKIAEHLFGLGYKLSLGSRGAKRPGALADWDEDRVLLQDYDAESADHAEDWVAATLAAFGRIDGLVNNAGIYRGVSLDEGEIEELDELWRVNVKAPFLLIRAALPALRKAGEGRVINVASASGKRIAGPAAGYTMSKFAVVALTHQVRRDAWDDGVRATALCPGFVNTDMAMGITQQRTAESMTQAEDLASIVALLLALPNTTSIAELIIQSTYESTL